MYQCPCYLPSGQRCSLSSKYGYCFNHIRNLSSHVPIKEYAKNLKMPGYNNIISRQLLIKFEEEQMKQQEMFLNMQEDLIDQEIRHAHVKKEHEEFVKRKIDVLEERRRSARQLKGLAVRHTQMYDQS